MVCVGARDSEMLVFRGLECCFVIGSIARGAVVEAPPAHARNATNPVVKVASYTQLATEALAVSYSGPADAEIAK